MEERTNALIARDRCLAAVPEAETIEQGQALWRWVKRYNLKAREKGGRGDIGLERLAGAAPLAQLLGGGLGEIVWGE